MNKPQSKEELHLAEAERLSEYAYDLLGFIMDQFPWGEVSTALELDKGLEQWQRDTAEMIRLGLDPSEVLQIAISSGHGIGKSAFVCMVILWALSTFVDCRVIVTANTESQLATKTWPELSKWYHMMRSNFMFEYTATSLFSKLKGHEKNWRADMQPWSETRPESFAGLHNKGKRAVVIFDEASAIADKVWETQEGAFTDADTERLWLVCGNPTRAIGRFKECFGRFRDQWKHRKVDSRTVSFTDKVKIGKWQKTYGEDSDYFRVRVRGEFPRVGNTQFFPAPDILAAARRDVPEVDRTEPLIMAVDVARFGSNKSVIRFRRGLDARTVPPLKFSGLNLMQLADKINEAYNSFKPHAVFIDETGIGGGVVDRCRQMRMKNIYGVIFSSKPDGIDFDDTAPRYANKRAEIYGRLREWLKRGCIDDDEDLRADLSEIQYGYNGAFQIQLEAKDDMEARGVQSPDDSDALAMTFGTMIGPIDPDDPDGGEADMMEGADYDPYRELV